MTRTTSTISWATGREGGRHLISARGQLFAIVDNYWGALVCACQEQVQRHCTSLPRMLEHMWGETWYRVSGKITTVCPTWAVRRDVDHQYIDVQVEASAPPTATSWPMPAGQGGGDDVLIPTGHAVLPPIGHVPLAPVATQFDIATPRGGASASDGVTCVPAQFSIATPRAPLPPPPPPPVRPSPRPDGPTGCKERVCANKLDNEHTPASHHGSDPANATWLHTNTFCLEMSDVTAAFRSIRTMEANNALPRGYSATLTAYNLANQLADGIKGRLIAIDGGGTSHPWKPATCGVAVLDNEVVTQAFGIGFFPPKGSYYTNDNFHGYGAEELGLAATLSELGKHNERGVHETNVADFILVMDNLKWSDSLMDDADLSFLTAATRKVVMSQLLSYREVLILDRDVVPYLSRARCKNRSGKPGKHWAPDMIGQQTSLTHHMDLTEPNRLCHIKMKALLGVTFLVDKSVKPKDHEQLGGPVIGVFIRGPSMHLNLGHWFQVCVDRCTELPMSRAMRRCQDGIGTRPDQLYADEKEKLVRSRRVANAAGVYPCESRWADGSTCEHDDVSLTEYNCKKRKGRTGVIWGNIKSCYRESTLYEFRPIVWWFWEQDWTWHPRAGPFVEWPKRIGDKATTWDQRR